VRIDFYIAEISHVPPIGNSAKSHLAFSSLESAVAFISRQHIIIKQNMSIKKGHGVKCAYSTTYVYL